MEKIGSIMNAMITYYAGDVKRINHFLKVYGFAKAIGEAEDLDSKTQEILEITALMHDIGIQKSEKKYHSSAGKYQEIEGPPEAKKLLQTMKMDSSDVERVCWLIAHHHTYQSIKKLDHQILVEADFLVNAFEDDLSKEAVIHYKNKVFRTRSGLILLDKMYGV